MPQKYSIKLFIENGYYHIYNRGVEKRDIFLEEKDYETFLSFLRRYLSPSENPTQQLKKINFQRSLHQEIQLIAYCLMPNHFHLLVKQTTSNAMTKLIQRLSTNYVMYFNQKYQREGTLFQGIYKAVLITTDEVLMHISRYIHLNPLVGNIINNLEKYKWSSYISYIKPERQNSIPLATSEVLNFFHSPAEYEKFVLGQVEYARELEKIKHLTIDLQN